MPYETSIKIELVNAMSEPVGGYNYVYHESRAFQPGIDGYFHAYYAGNSVLSFPWQPALLLPAAGVKGPGHMVGTSMVFSTAQPTHFAGNFDHVCEGNYEFFLDNETVCKF